eukprot:scaffold73325_cov17-Tisochrysis_lutea.AAC.1
MDACIHPPTYHDGAVGAKAHAHLLQANVHGFGGTAGGHHHQAAGHGGLGAGGVLLQMHRSAGDWRIIFTCNMEGDLPHNLVPMDCAGHVQRRAYHPQ